MILSAVKRDRRLCTWPTTSNKAVLFPLAIWFPLVLYFAFVCSALKRTKTANLVSNLLTSDDFLILRHELRKLSSNACNNAHLKLASQLSKPKLHQMQNAQKLLVIVEAFVIVGDFCDCWSLRTLRRWDAQLKKRGRNVNRICFQPNYRWDSPSPKRTLSRSLTTHFHVRKFTSSLALSQRFKHHPESGIKSIKGTTQLFRIVPNSRSCSRSHSTSIFDKFSACRKNKTVGEFYDPIKRIFLLIQQKVFCFKEDFDLAREWPKKKENLIQRS